MVVGLYAARGLRQLPGAVYVRWFQVRFELQALAWTRQREWIRHPMSGPTPAEGLLCHGDEDAALVTLHQEGYGVLVVSLGDRVADFLHRLHCLAVHLTDDIATLQASALRRTAWLDTDNHDTFRLLQTALTGHPRRDVLELQTPLARGCLTGLLAGGLLGRQFANRHRHFLGLAIATQRHCHMLAHWGLGHQRWQVVRILNRLVVKARNHIPLAEARLGRWAARHDF